MEIQKNFEAYFEDIHRALRSHRAEYRAQIGRYFSDLCFRLDNYRNSKNRLDIFLSSDFNVFSLIRPDENKLSDIVADLLNVEGTHGQGDVFLHEFLLMANIKPKKKSISKIFREDATTYISHSNRRLDIIIVFSDFAIGIENKPWAIDQKDQIKDYHKHLEKKYGGNYSLVYMSGNGSSPSSIGDDLRDQLIKQGKLILFPYPSSFLEWLTRCKKQCESEKYRWFLRDFTEYVYVNFSFS